MRLKVFNSNLGYGKCVQRFRAISVLRNFGTAFQPDWREYTLNVPVVCDCQITQNSAISGLVLN